MAFTFRKEPRETGLAGVGRPNPSTEVKLGGKVCGRIEAPYFGTPDRKWGVTLAVAQEPTEAKPADFHWINFKARFDTEPEAREWFKRNEKALTERYQIYKFED